MNYDQEQSFATNLANYADELFDRFLRFGKINSKEHAERLLQLKIGEVEQELRRHCWSIDKKSADIMIEKALSHGLDNALWHCETGELLFNAFDISGYALESHGGKGKLAKAEGVSASTVSRWVKKEYIVYNNTLYQPVRKLSEDWTSKKWQDK